MPPEILMPALSPTMEEGNLAKWHVKVGDKVKPGDIIAEIETDKATMEVEAVDEGVVSRLVVPEGAQGVKVNAVIAELAGEGEAPAKGNGGAAKAEPKPAPVAAKPAEAKAPAATPGAAAASAAQPVERAPALAAPSIAGQRVRVSPLARRLAKAE